MRHVAMAVCLLIGLPSSVLADIDSDYQICVINNAQVMGSSFAEDYCDRLRQEARRRQEVQQNTPDPIEAQYQDCIINNTRTMGDINAENYCNKLRNEARQRQQILGR